MPAAAGRPCQGEFIGYILIPRDGYYTFYKKRGAFDKNHRSGYCCRSPRQERSVRHHRIEKGSAYHLDFVPDTRAKQDLIQWSGPGLKTQDLSNTVLHVAKQLR